MKDKLGHGSEKHREFHKPQVEHGKYGKGRDHHTGLSLSDIGKSLKIWKNRGQDHDMAGTDSYAAILRDYGPKSKD
jgi:hypothetical protein